MPLQTALRGIAGENVERGSPNFTQSTHVADSWNFSTVELQPDDVMPLPV